MTKKILCLAFTALVMWTILTGCSSPLAKSQLEFGIQAARKDLWDEAIFRWTRVLENSPNSAAAHNNLAVAYEKKGRLQDAAREYELAVKISPSNKYIQSNYEKLKKILENQESNNPEEKKKSNEKK